MTWTELVEDFVLDQPDWSPRTRAWYRTRLRHFTGFLAGRRVSHPAQIEVRHINRHLADLRNQNLSWSTRNGAYTAISAWFTWLRRMRLVQQNPFKQDDADTGLRRPRKTRQVIQDIPLLYVRKMIRAAEADPTLYGLRDVAIMRLLITTGMRREELTTLQLHQLNMERDELLIIGKGGHQRFGFLRPETKAALQRWLSARPRVFSQALFISLQPNKNGLYRQLRPDAINDIIIKWRDRAGLPRVSLSPHKWRHTFATQLAKSGDLFTLQHLMGHSDIQTTRRYVHTSKLDMRLLIIKQMSCWSKARR